MNNKLNMPVQAISDKELRSLGLPTCSYQEMIKQIQQEIKNKNSFLLSSQII